jgi:hypothetical protein
MLSNSQAPRASSIATEPGVGQAGTSIKIAAGGKATQLGRQSGNDLAEPGSDADVLSLPPFDAQYRGITT